MNLDADPDMLDFAELTAPVAPQEFFATYWTRRAVHCRTAGRTFDRYFGWPALNALLNSGDLTFPATLVSREESPVPPEAFTRGERRIDSGAVMRLFREGASFSIRGADAHWAPLKPLIAGLYDTLFESIHTNVYCSPAATQGFRCHYDLHEVFVLQIEGAKHWKVFDPSDEFPLDPWRPEDAPDGSARPYLDAVLERGDVLYVPRGHWHYATARDSHSLHITVGVTCRNGESLLDWLRSELRQHPAWRRNLPLMGGPRSDGGLPVAPEVTDWAESLRRALLDTLSAPGVLQRYVAHLFTGTIPIPTVEMPRGADDIPQRWQGVTFRRPPGQRHLIEGQGEDLTLHVAGAEMRLSGVSRELLGRILAAPSFTIDDLRTWAPGLAEDDRNELLAMLVDTGLLIAAGRPDGA
jgi:hypothetical protein